MLRANMGHRFKLIITNSWICNLNAFTLNLVFLKCGNSLTCGPPMTTTSFPHLSVAQLSLLSWPPSSLSFYPQPSMVPASLPVTCSSYWFSVLQSAQSQRETGCWRTLWACVCVSNAPTGLSSFLLLYFQILHCMDIFLLHHPKYDIRPFEQPIMLKLHQQEAPHLLVFKLHRQKKQQWWVLAVLPWNTNRLWPILATA